jgi:cell division protein FtsW
MARFDPKIGGDRIIWAVVILLTFFSILAVYSSTTTLAYKVMHGNTEFYLMKHLGILIFAFILMYIAHKINYIYYSRLSQVALFISVPLLLYTLLFGISINDASRWTTLPGVNLTFQSSDVAKLALIMFLARLLAKRQENIKDLKTGFLPVILPVLVVCALILPANFSTAAMLFVTSIVLMFIGRAPLKYIFALVGIGVVFLSIFVTILIVSPKVEGRVGVWQDRIEHFGSGDSEDNFQVEQAKIAIARGGILGKFPGNSIQKNFLPNPFNDFIYAIIIEEYGLWGGILILLLYLILLYRGIMILKKSPKNFGALLAIGVTFSLVFQAFINIAVAVNIVPVTGQPLPLVSMGGTSIWFTSIAIGIVLSVSRDIENNPEALEENATV